MILPKESQESIEESSAGDPQEELSTIKCESCNYSCLLKEDLQQYVVSVHEGKKLFKCDSCKYSFILKDDLQQHITTVYEGLIAGMSKSTTTTIKPKSSKTCKSTWNGTKCLARDCLNVHIAPCHDRESLALDDGLPLHCKKNSRHDLASISCFLQSRILI